MGGGNRWPAPQNPNRQRGGVQLGRNRAQPPNRPPPPVPQQPPQPTIMPLDAIPDDVAQWTTQMLRVLGWNSKKVEHGQLDVEIGQILQGFGNQPSPLITDLAQQHQELSDAYALNGVWDSTQEMQASEIKATLAFESMPNQRAALQTGSANPTFWVHGAPDPVTQETREYIFKPAMKGGLMAGHAVRRGAGTRSSGRAGGRAAARVQRPRLQHADHQRHHGRPHPAR